MKIAVAGLVAVAVAWAAACTHAESQTSLDVQPEDEVWLTPDQMAKANITVVEAKPQALGRALTVGGKVAFDDLHVSHVFSPVTGRVTRVLVKPGEHVKKGAALVGILSPDVGTAFSDVVKAQADLQALEIDFHRQEHLLAEEATSQRSVEAAADAYHRAAAESARAQQRAALLRGNGVDNVTQEYMLRSFIDGEVIMRSVNPGTEVAGQYAGGNSNELFTIGDVKSVWVWADVPDVELPKLKVGDPVEVRVIAYPDRVFKGTIDLVANTVDPVLRTGRIRATFENQNEELKPEMYATVAVVRGAVEQLAVPRDAVVGINEARFVYVQTGTRADHRLVFKRRPVKIGDERDGMIPVFDGLAAGEHVVDTGAALGEQTADSVWPTGVQIKDSHIETAVVESRPVSDIVLIGGRLAFNEDKVSHVFSPVSGRITRVLVQLGQHIKKGTPLVAIVSPDLGGYMADVVKADADRVQAEHEYQRQKELFDAGVGAKRDLEAADSALRKAKAEYDRAKQLTELLRSGDFDTISQEYVLRSPIEGDVVARHANPGTEIQGQYSNGGASSNVLELFTIGDLGQLWLLGDVFERDVPRVDENDAITLHIDSAPDQPLHGRVDWVADVLDPTTHTAKIRCLIDNSARLLRPEMYVRVDVAIPPVERLVVPRASLMRLDGETMVFVKTGNTRSSDGGIEFVRRKVVARLEDNAPTVAVLSGLKAGDVVATEHSLMLLGMM